MSTSPFQEILAGVDNALLAAADPAFQARQQGYSKEAITSYGVRTSTVRAIAKEVYAQAKHLPVDDFLALCEETLARGSAEHRCVALAWAYNRRKDLKPTHFPTLLGWLQRHVSDWSACDQLCCEVFGDFMVRYPAFTSHCLDWATSDNRWLRRASAVILIPSLRNKGSQFELVLKVAETLLPDRDDLVQKGYGWSLKEATERGHDQAVFEWIMVHKAAMSRTALRYAIEKLDSTRREQAMARDMV